jgi:antitoxin ParD1/3/4
MRISLELSPELEAKLRNSITLQDRDSIRQLLTEAFTPMVEALLQEASKDIGEEDFETSADELAAILVEYTGSDFPFLSDYAVSRQGIYEEHP